jgi:hypothetical protein
MATKTGVTGKLKILAEIFDDDAAGAGAENFNLAGANHLIEALIPWATGTSDGQINLVWSDRIALAASGTTTLDLAGGLTDAFGHTLTFTVIKLLIVRNRNIVAGDNLKVGPAASNGWVGFWLDATDRNLVKAGIAGHPGLLILYEPAGIAVTGGTGDNLIITELGAANTLNYDILIAGEGTYT